MVAPADDTTVDLDRARRLFEASCPDLRGEPVALLGSGWDHQVYIAGGWVCRFPRNQAAADALQLELELLPWIAAQVPSAIPVPTLRGVVDERTGWSFAAHRFVPGVTVCDLELAPEARALLAEPLARFVRALHAIDVEQAPRPLPGDVLQRLDPASRERRTRKQLATWQADGVLPLEVAKRLFRALDGWPGAPDDAAVLVHADLHTRNVLALPGGQLSGIIDWVDVHRGHRELDLATAFEVLPPAARETFFIGYGSPAPAAVARARWRAIDHTTRAFAGSIERRDDVFARVSQRALIEMSVD